MAAFIGIHFPSKGVSRGGRFKPSVLALSDSTSTNTTFGFPLICADKDVLLKQCFALWFRAVKKRMSS